MTPRGIRGGIVESFTTGDDAIVFARDAFRETMYWGWSKFIVVFSVWRGELLGAPKLSGLPDD